MAKQLQLHARLRAIAGCVRKGHIAADIGTDHAYLPVYLIQKQICPLCVASDIRIGPLLNARETVEEHGLVHSIHLVQANGLQHEAFEQAQDIIIAGMGGDVITAILQQGDSFAKAAQKRLILQPMTRAEEVHEYLGKNGFHILRENAVCENGYSYVIITAEYDGICRFFTGTSRYIGALQCKDGASRDFVQRQHRRLKKELDGLARANKQAHRRAELSQILLELEDMSKE